MRRKKHRHREKHREKRSDRRSEKEEKAEPKPKKFEPLTIGDIVEIKKSKEK